MPSSHPEPDTVERQRRFYADRSHDHLRARSEDLYAGKLAATLAQRAGIGPGERVLEAGAGFGRFTFHLLEHCGSLVALDLSERTLADLERERDRRGIDGARCRTAVADLQGLDDVDLGGPFDHVVGFYILHHLPDYPAAIRSLAGQLRPGGRMTFLEPNRWNPLFALQLACCADMTWAEERGMFTLARRGVRDAFAAAGLTDGSDWTFGFFPPPVFNRSAWARRSEAWLESRRSLARVLPFLVVSARRPGGAEA